MIDNECLNRCCFVKEKKPDGTIICNRGRNGTDCCPKPIPFPQESKDVWWIRKEKDTDNYRRTEE